jgi:hypothetical protein
VNVDADVEDAVIPVGVMLLAPVAFAIEAIDVVTDLRAVRAEPGGVAIDLFFGVLEATVAFVSPVVVGARRAAQRKRESDDKRGCEDEAETFLGHGQFLPEVWEYDRGGWANRRKRLFRSRFLL